MSTPRRLNVEGLEKRAMLAGNVAVSVDGGSLIIRGDGANNGVSVEQIDGDSYAVGGFSVNGGADTQINGGAFFIAHGVTNDVDVDLNAGSDIFLMDQNSANRANNAAILGATGVDDFGNAAGLSGTQTRVYRNLIVRMDEGHDRVGIQARVGSDDIRGEDFGGIAHIITGVGADHVLVSRTTAFDDLLIETGDHNDEVAMYRIAVWDFLFTALGSGHDNFFAGVARNYAGGTFNPTPGLASSGPIRSFHSHVIGGSGDDFMQIDNGYHAALEIFLYGEAGNDVIAANGVTAEDLQIITHDGQDRMQLTGSTIRDDLYIDLGSESENYPGFAYGAFLNNVAVGDLLHVVLGAGNDSLGIANTSSGDTLLDGSSGFDNLDLLGGNNLRSATIINFEA